MSNMLIRMQCGKGFDRVLDRRSQLICNTNPVNIRPDPIASILSSFLYTYFFPCIIIPYMTQTTKKTPIKKKKSTTKKKKSMAVIKREAKEELFCQRYVDHFNGSKAAIEAKYAPKSSAATASKLLTKPNIIARIAQLSKRTTDKLELTRDMVVAELAKVGFSSIKNFVDDDGTILPLRKVSDDHAASISSLEVDSITSTTTGKPIGTTKKMKLHSKIEALKVLDNYFKEDDGDGDGSEKPDDKFL